MLTGCVCVGGSVSVGRGAGGRGVGVPKKKQSARAKKMKNHSTLPFSFHLTSSPGTAACPNGHFFCINAGHVPKVLNSSFVDDGVCGACWAAL